MGRGDGSWRFQGDASGRGQRQCGDLGQYLTTGGVVATGFTVFMCLCGVPMVMAGAVLVFIKPGNPLGLTLLGMSASMAVVGLVLIALIWKGVFIKDHPVSQTSVDYTTPEAPVAVGMKQTPAYWSHYDGINGK